MSLTHPQPTAEITARLTGKNRRRFTHCRGAEAMAPTHPHVAKIWIRSVERLFVFSSLQTLFERAVDTRLPPRESCEDKYSYRSLVKIGNP